jgi:hypothetical protein
LTIVGRATSGSGDRPTITVSTEAEQAGISINVSNVDKVNSAGLTNSVNSNRLRQMLLLKGLNPGGVFMYIDFNQRYICPIFNQAIQNESLTGLLV